MTWDCGVVLAPAEPLRPLLAAGFLQATASLRRLDAPGWCIRFWSGGLWRHFIPEKENRKTRMIAASFHARKGEEG